MQVQFPVLGKKNKDLTHILWLEQKYTGSIFINQKLHSMEFISIDKSLKIFYLTGLLDDLHVDLQLSSRILHSLLGASDLPDSSTIFWKYIFLGKQ